MAEPGKEASPGQCPADETHMTYAPSSVELAQSLIGYNTISGGNERQALEPLAKILSDAGFSVAFDAYDPSNPQRCSLFARLRPESDMPALCLCGHIDTVPLGAAQWRMPPFEGRIQNGLLYGRGSSDMKSGVAAMVCAAAQMARHMRGDLVVQVYGGEETGCEGSFHMAAQPQFLRNIAAVVVAEPTSCRPLCGHKGALWLTCKTTGITAHASMPHKGDNALAKLLPFADAMCAFRLEGDHPQLGGGTCVVSTLHAGCNSNSVPDSAAMTIDIRTAPQHNHDEIRTAVAAMAGSGISMTTTLDVPAVWTDPAHPWMNRAFDVLTPLLGHRPDVATVQFFTDAAALRPRLPDVPIMILGPGDPSMAHQVDEYCAVEQIELGTKMYSALLADWCA